jgi:hypothetical protein
MGVCVLLLVACSGERTVSGQPSPAVSPDVSSATTAKPSRTQVPALIGTWDHRYNRADAKALLRDFAGLVDDADSVVARLAFVDEDEWWLGFLFDGELVLVDGVPEGDGGSYSVDGDRLTTTGAHDEVLVTYKWALTGARLRLTAVEECTLVAGTKTNCQRDRSAMDPLMLMVTEHTFIRSGDDTTY